MEKKLKAIFDYQKFEKNPRLEKLISQTENRYAKELSEEDLSLVSAAGDMIAPNESEKNHGHVYKNSP